jgi:hypothetical protein
MRLTALFASLLVLLPVLATAEDKPAETPFTIAEGKLALKAPAGWVKKQPKINFIEAEFEIPVAEGDEIPGRLTAMGAGGSIEQNIERWTGQFVAGEEPVKPKVEKKTIAGSTVHLVDLAGTYKDMPSGPFAGGKTTLRENYRMLGAIIATKEDGNYFLKLYGPKATITENEKGFHAMIESLSAQ